MMTLFELEERLITVLQNAVTEVNNRVTPFEGTFEDLIEGIQDVPCLFVLTTSAQFEPNDLAGTGTLRQYALRSFQVISVFVDRRKTGEVNSADNYSILDKVRDALVGLNLSPKTCTMMIQIRSEDLLFIDGVIRAYVSEFYYNEPYSRVIRSA